MNGQKICILVDSGCDVPQAVRQDYDMRVLPLKIRYPEGEYDDQVNITAQQVYDRFPGEIPQTSLPDGGTIHDALDRARADGYEKALVICISSGLSGTYNMVRLMCQEYQGMETFVLDTRNISFGSGVFALLAAHWIAGGMDWQDLQIRLVQRLEDSKVFFCVDTLEYLRKGGRLGLVAAIVGTALKLKPIISCNEAGVYYIAGKALGRGKSLDRMLNLAAAFAASKEGSQVALLNGDAPREALELQPRLLEKTLCKELLAEGQISPALVVHTGPGLLGIAVLRGGLDG